jgi:hypothetical protein
MRIGDQRTTLGVTLAATIALVLAVSGTAGATVSTKLVSSSRFGWNVDKTKIDASAPQLERDLCTVASKDTCQAGEQTGEAGGFDNLDSVAVDQANGNLYVADTNNHRVEQFNSNGEFTLTFGWKVDKTTGANICTAASGDKCGAGEAGEGLAGQLNGPQDVAVDPETHDVYVLELFDKRVDEYTPQGEFVLMIGGNVDRTKVEAGASEPAENLCTAASHDTCQAGEFQASGPAHGAFRKFAPQDRGDLLAVGGPEHLLYVADEGRVQELARSGEWKNQIPLTAISATARASALAVNPAGDVYLAAIEKGTEVQLGGVHELDGSGKEAPGFATSAAGEIGAGVRALALDPGTGRLAVIEALQSGGLAGALYDAGGTRLSTFEPSGGLGGVEGVAFNANDELYAAESTHEDVGVFKPASIPLPLTGLCKNRGAGSITLTGEVNPESVAETTVWFQYGTTPALGATTPAKQVAGGALVPVEATLEGLPPDEIYYYRTVAEGETDRGQPDLAKETLSCQTLLVAPGIEGEPESGDVTFSSAVLFGAVNPENASSEYWFQYAAYRPGVCETLAACAGALQTKRLESSAYGVVGVALAASGLQPSTTYLYRLAAVNRSKNGQEQHESVGAEGSFTTPSAPSPFARTGEVGAVSATSAILNGTVDPGGAGATYAFQVGIDKGAGTVYSTVAQGATGAEANVVSESFTLTGLQPGTTYAYKLTIASAYGVSEGVPVTFTTAGLPQVVFAPPVLAQLPVPGIAFPGASPDLTPKRLTRAQQLASALRACARKPKSKRGACVRNARKKYVVNTNARGRKKHG